jgi:hypothetical protein
VDTSAQARDAADEATEYRRIGGLDHEDFGGKVAQLVGVVSHGPRCGRSAGGDDGKAEAGPHAGVELSFKRGKGRQ